MRLLTHYKLKAPGVPYVPGMRGGSAKLGGFRGNTDGQRVGTGWRRSTSGGRRQGCGPAAMTCFRPSAPHALPSRRMRPVICRPSVDVPPRAGGERHRGAVALRALGARRPLSAARLLGPHHATRSRRGRPTTPGRSGPGGQARGCGDAAADAATARGGAWVPAAALSAEGGGARGFPRRLPLAQPHRRGVHRGAASAAGHVAGPDRAWRRGLCDARRLLDAALLGARAAAAPAAAVRRSRAPCSS